MSAKIILTQADFSQNNIGRLSLISDFTKKVLAKQTQYSESDAEAVALDTFLNKLISRGYIGGANPVFKVLLIPALASKHDELFFNLAKVDADGYPVDWMPSDEAEAETKKYEVLANGGYNIGVMALSLVGVDRGYGFSADGHFISGAPLPSTSLITYICNPMTASNLPIRALIGVNTYAPAITLSCTMAGTNAIFNSPPSTNFVRAVTDRTTCDKGFYGMSFDAENNDLKINLNGTTTATLTKDGVSPTLSYGDLYNNQFPLFGSNNNPVASANSAMAILGDKMTEAQLAEVKAWSDILMTALHI